MVFFRISRVHPIQPHYYTIYDWALFPFFIDSGAANGGNMLNLEAAQAPTAIVFPSLHWSPALYSDLWYIAYICHGHWRHVFLVFRIIAAEALVNIKKYMTVFSIFSTLPYCNFTEHNCRIVGLHLNKWLSLLRWFYSHADCRRWLEFDWICTIKMLRFIVTLIDQRQRWGMRASTRFSCHWVLQWQKHVKS